MKTHSFKRWIAGLLSAALCLSAFLGLGITKAFAKGEQAEVSLVSFPREGDANYSTTTWGHDDIKLMNGWFFQKGKYLTVYSMGSYNGKICYCIEPSTMVKSGDRLRALGGEIINISATSPTHINAMDMTREYGDGANPVILKSEFIMSLCEQLIGGSNLGAVQKSIIDRCTAAVYRNYQQNDYTGAVPTLQDFRAELIKQPEPEAQEIALSIELFTNGSLNTFAKRTNVDTDNRLICYDILDLGKQLMPIGMLVVLDSILNRITANRAKGKNTFIFIDEIYLLFQHEYSANFLFTLWKRVRKYGAYATGITQNVDDLLQSHTARTMLANSEFIIMLNQAPTDRIELAKLLNISDNQLSYITNVGAGHGLIKVGSSLIPFANKFPKNTKLYKLMTTKPGEEV